ncbi:GNAT family N-acetyltransferase [Vibrio lamellibrachiae]|uniref:GNAT family N-acetyltransferase n=1 Tax=Vibrio lamellibrachiae TaxID=2910253 RepID=UPI003D104ED0
MIYQYIEDHKVTEELDQKLRSLLSASFVNGQDSEVFSRQRFYNEPPQHRYMIWNEEELVAHVAVHDKQVLINDEAHSICGIAEVCVHSDYRKQGLVKRLLDNIHQDRTERGDAFSVLFGDVEVYGSSGYECKSNITVFNPEKEWVAAGKVMAYALNQSWPEGEVKLIGIPF